MTTETELEVAAKKREVEKLKEAMEHVKELTKLRVHAPFFDDDLMRLAGKIQVQIWWRE